jgi:hypothetical protein
MNPPDEEAQAGQTNQKAQTVHFEKVGEHSEQITTRQLRAFAFGDFSVRLGVVPFLSPLRT